MRLLLLTISMSVWQSRERGILRLRDESCVSRTGGDHRSAVVVKCTGNVTSPRSISGCSCKTTYSFLIWRAVARRAGLETTALIKIFVDR
jgi:hypothetical protein